MSFESSRQLINGSLLEQLDVVLLLSREFSSSVSSALQLSGMMKSSNMSEKNGAVSSNGMQASPAVGAKCVKSSGSSFSTRTRADEIVTRRLRRKEEIHSKFAKNYETVFNRDEEEADAQPCTLSCQGSEKLISLITFQMLQIGVSHIHKRTSEKLFIDRSSSCDKLSVLFRIAQQCRRNEL